LGLVLCPFAFFLTSINFSVFAQSAAVKVFRCDNGDSAEVGGMFAKNASHSENPLARLAIAKEVESNQENATQPFVLDQSRKLKQMHGRSGTVCYPEAIFGEERMPFRNG
jgi:hypothetical protein